MSTTSANELVVTGSRPSRARRMWREHIKPLAIVVTCLLSFRSAVADWYDVPTGSMNPTIVEGDRIVVNKMAYDLRIPFTSLTLAEVGDPQRGDIVVFTSPKDGMRLVKRLVGVPGDTIQLRNNVLFINAQPASYQPLDAQATRYLPAAERFQSVFANEQIPDATGKIHSTMQIPSRPSMRNFGPVTVPPGEYFMLGDNRDNSADSRVIGFVDRSLIRGRAGTVAFSLTDSYVPRWSRFFAGLR